VNGFWNFLYENPNYLGGESTNSGPMGTRGKFALLKPKKLNNFFLKSNNRPNQQVVGTPKSSLTSCLKIYEVYWTCNGCSYRACGWWVHFSIFSFMKAKLGNHLTTNLDSIVKMYTFFFNIQKDFFTLCCNLMLEWSEISLWIKVVTNVINLLICNNLWTNVCLNTS
jgi:hypothetical protein